MSLKIDAQDVKIDSLINVIENGTEQEEFDALFQLSRIYYNRNDYLHSLEVAKRAEEVASSEIGDSLLIVKSGRIIGFIYSKMDNHETAISNYQRVLAIAERNNFRDQVKVLLNLIATSHALQANFDKALEYYYQDLILREIDGDLTEISIAYNNIGFVYFKLNDYDQGLKYFEKSEELIRQSGNLTDLDHCLINIGLCYIGLNEYNKAIKSFTDGLELCGQDCSEETLTEGHYGLGIAYFNTDRLSLAKKEFKLSYRNAGDGNTRFIIENLIQLSQISIKEMKYDSAYEYIAAAEEMAESTNYNQLKIKVYENLAEYYTIKSDFKNAAKYQSKYIHLKDSIYSDELIKNMARVQTNFEERENIATIASKEVELDRQRRFIFAVAVIAVLAAALVFVLYRSNQTKKRVNVALSKANETIENQNAQLTTLNKNLEMMVDARTMELQVVNQSLKRVNDELDNFIYKTSHDIRGPLASLRGICNVAILDVQDPVALDYFGKLDATAEKLNVILTRLLIINQINSSTTAKELIDFQQIVEEVIMLERKRGLPPRLKINSDIDQNITFYSDKELVRIILENLIDNAIKFYNDSERVNPFVSVTVRKNGSKVNVSVIDNGIGVSEVNPDKIFQIFSRASERSGSGGIGLYLTKTAAEKIGGRIDLKTTPEGFTEFYVEFATSTSKMKTEVTV